MTKMTCPLRASTRSVEIDQGVQRVDGQAHPGQVHGVDDRPDDCRLIRLLAYPALGDGQPGVVPEEPQVLGCFLALDLGAARCFAVGAQPAQRGDMLGVAVHLGGQDRVAPGDRDTAGGRPGREFRAAAGDGCRAGRSGGRGGLPLLPGGLAGFVLRLGAGRPVPPGRLAGLLFRFPCPRPGPAGLSFGFAGLIAALFLQLRRGQDLARGGQLTGPLAQHIIGQVVIDHARDPPYRLLRRGDVHPGPLAARAAQLLQHPLRAARRPLPDRGERVTPGQPRGDRDRDHARHAEPHPPRIPPVRQPRQPHPQ